ncbi:MAG: hypothetical protein GZ088_08705 [Acidipila sp.]|nr:hypothetical protein [Acidipila sp.]
MEINMKETSARFGRRWSPLSAGVPAPVLIGAPLLLGALLCVAGCGGRSMRSGEPRVETSSTKLGRAKAVSVTLTMGAGEMKVSDDAPDLMNGTFSYNDPAQKPKIGYVDSSDHAQLTIEQPGDQHSHVGGDTYSWDVRLNKDVITELHVQLGAGKLNLVLGDLPLTRLHVEMGAGSSLVDLVGNWKHDVDVHLEGGVGNATVRLPRSVGVRVSVHGGLGSVSSDDFKKNGDAYVNDQFGKSPITVNVKIEGGIGKVVLELAGGPTV